MSDDFASYQRALMPAGLAGPYGIAWATGQGAAKDQLVTEAKDAVKARFLDLAPVDALPRIAADRVIEIVDGESSASWRARLVAAWESWSWLGTRYGIGLAVGLLGYGHPAVLSWRALPWDTRSDLWARLRVIYTGRASWTGTPWGSWAWGSRLVEPIESADPTVARPRLRRVLRQWINARDRVYTVNVAAGHALWGRFVWGGGAYATGTQTIWGPPPWGSTEARWGAFVWGVFC